VAAATAIVKPTAARDAALTTASDTSDAIDAIDYSTFDKDKPMFGSRLKSKHAMAKANAEVLAASVDAAAKLSAEVDSEYYSEAVKSIAELSKRSKQKFERLLVDELATNPAGFTDLAAFTERVNMAAGIKADELKIGDKCTWIDSSKAGALAVKVEVSGSADPSTGLISIKVWTESDIVQQSYTEGFTTEAVASRKDLYGGVPKPKQPIPTGLLTRAEQHRWLIIEGAKARKKVVLLLRKIEKMGLKCSMQLQLLDADLKSVHSASRKVFGDNCGDFRELLDLVRFTFKGVNMAAVVWVYEAVWDEPDFEILVLKNRLDPRLPAPAGYRDTCVVVLVLFAVGSVAWSEAAIIIQRLYITLLRDGA
jgi:hypothetical protein